MGSRQDPVPLVVASTTAFQPRKKAYDSQAG